MPLKLIYITNDPKVALIAEKNEVDRIMVDLESIGKEERQKNMDSVKSKHSIDDIKVLSNSLTSSELLVRVNAIHPGSALEIDQAISAGADAIMLPMWKTVEEVKDFLSHVDGRAKTLLLLETKEAVGLIDEILELGGFDEIYIGLNDLHLSYGLTFMFEPLANGTVETLCKKMKAAGVKYGFGGIARIGEGLLPAERIAMEHYRLGSSCVILSRSFCNTKEITDFEEIEAVFEKNTALLRKYESTIPDKTEEDFAENREMVKQCVGTIVRVIKERG